MNVSHHFFKASDGRVKSIAEIIWPPVRFRMERTPGALLLRRAPDRSWWNVLVLPAVILLLALADYNIDGQGPMTQFIGKYVVPTVLAGSALLIVFQWETVRVDGEALTIESLFFGWRRCRRIPLGEIERLQYDPGSAGSDGSSSEFRLKRTGHALLVTFARDITEEQANEFLMAIRFVVPGSDSD